MKVLATTTNFPGKVAPKEKVDTKPDKASPNSGELDKLSENTPPINSGELDKTSENTVPKFEATEEKVSSPGNLAIPAISGGLGNAVAKQLATTPPGDKAPPNISGAFGKTTHGTGTPTTLVDEKGTPTTLVGEKGAPTTLVDEKGTPTTLVDDPAVLLLMNLKAGGDEASAADIAEKEVPKLFTAKGESIDVRNSFAVCFLLFLFLFLHCLNIFLHRL